MRSKYTSATLQERPRNCLWKTSVSPSQWQPANWWVFSPGSGAFACSVMTSSSIWTTSQIIDQHHGHSCSCSSSASASWAQSRLPARMSWFTEENGTTNTLECSPSPRYSTSISEMCMCKVTTSRWQLPRILSSEESMSPFTYLQPRSWSTLTWIKWTVK